MTVGANPPAPSMNMTAAQAASVRASALLSIRSKEIPEPQIAGSVPDLTHDDLAMELYEVGWREYARYWTARGKFMFWTGTHWAIDEKRYALTLVRNFLRDKAERLLAWAMRHMEKIADEKERGSFLKTIKHSCRELKSAGTVAAVHGMMGTNTDTAIVADEMDTNHWLLGTPGGVVNLRDGTLHPANPLDLITKTTAVKPAPQGTPAPIWNAFLTRVMGGDSELVAFLQRAFGYALTGLTTEHKFTFLYGTGRNGKGVFLNTVMNVMGAYSRKAAPSVFIEQRNADHPTNLAGLQGARFVFGSEIPEGAFWNETMIKDCTGGDVLTARYMRGDFFDFTPEFFLAIAGNSKPALRSVDQAIRDRLLVVPFTQYIPPEERDPDLPDKLREEWPAILRWMIDGCLMWQRDGLAPPAAVKAASDDYLASEDLLQQYMDMLYMRDAAGAVPAVQFCDSYNAWRSREGLQQLPNVKITKEMESKGYPKQKVRNAGSRHWSYVGLGLLLLPPGII